MKQILFFVAANGFRDEEYFEPKQILEDAGHICEVTSTTPDMAQGKLGAVIMPTISLDSIIVDDFDAFVLVGGPGAAEMGNDFRIQDTIKEAYEKNKIICAICAAPAILAKMGLVENKSVTAHPSVLPQVKEFFGNIKEEPVVVDISLPPKILITANGPESSVEFGKTISEYI